VISVLNAPVSGSQHIMSDINDDPESPYIEHERDGRYEVCAASGRVIMVCNDQSSASHYAVLLNEAYRAGYKVGYRDGHNK
jgi:hypothetical protein